MIHEQELLENIFFRLPAKSIGRFRCVSQPWRTLLSEPNFIKTHHNRIKQLKYEEQSLILVPKSRSSSSFYTCELKIAKVDETEMTAFAAHLITFDDHCPVRKEYVGSCDGLTLVNGVLRLYLGNPTTKEFKELPQWPRHPCHHRSSTMYGLGYHSTTDDYKVGVFSPDYYSRNKDNIEVDLYVQLYSVRNGTWKASFSCPFKYHIYGNLSGISVDGFIHWVATNLLDESCVILAFDLSQEKLSEMPPPSAMERYTVDGHKLSRLGGCLCMYMTSYTKTNIWVMKEYGVVESWIKFTIIDTKETIYRPIRLLRTEQIVLAKVPYQKVKDQLVIYNLNDGSFEDVVIEGTTDVFGVGGTFMDSLVSPHCTVEEARED